MPGMTPEDVDHIFKYHPPIIIKQVERFQDLRLAGRTLARAILRCTPSSPEQTLAIRKVQEAIFWGNAAIALNEARVRPDQVAPPAGPAAPSAPPSAPAVPPAPAPAAPPAPFVPGAPSAPPVCETLHVYATGPIDFWEGVVPQFFWPSSAQTYYWKVILPAFEAHRFWSDPIREGPYLSGIPMADGLELGWVFFLKINNNGTTFVASPVQLPWLKHAHYMRLEVPKIGDRNGTSTF